MQNNKIVKENEKKEEDVERHWFFKLVNRVIKLEVLQIEKNIKLNL